MGHASSEAVVARVGHHPYYGITGNAKSLAAFRDGLTLAWRRWLNRRSHKARMWWHKFKKLLAKYPHPPARAIHSKYHVANPVA